jgi:hypothetical protein
MPPKSYRPLPSHRSLAATRFYPTGGVQRRGQFFRRGAQQSRPVERKAMIDRTHDLPITKQAAALNISLLPAPAGVGSRPRPDAAD